MGGRVNWAMLLAVPLCAAAACSVSTDNLDLGSPGDIATGGSTGEEQSGGGAGFIDDMGEMQGTPMAATGGTTAVVTPNTSGGVGGTFMMAPAQGGAAPPVAGTGGTPGSAGTGGVTGPAGTGGTPGSGGSSDGSGAGGRVTPPVLPPSQGGAGGSRPLPLPESGRPRSFDFEQDAQGWLDLKKQGSDVSRTTSRAATGSASLEAKIDTKGKSGEDLQRYIGVPKELVPALRAGQQINFRVWVPAASKLQGVQPFVVTGAGRWQGTFRFIDSLSKGDWNDISVTLPNDFDVTAPEWLGVQFFTQEGGWKGSVFIDSVLF